MPLVKLTADQVDTIRGSGTRRGTGSFLAKRYKVSRSTISRVRNYKTWK